MSLLFCRNLTVEIAGSALLSDLSFKIEHREKIGLIGVNGAGKTTLLRVITGELPYAQGFLETPEKIGYLPQIPLEPNAEGTIFESLLAERGDILRMRNDLRFLELRISQEAGAGSAAEKTLERYGALTEAYENAGGYALEAKIRRIINGLGLEGEQDKEIRNLSGGQKTRLALGKLLLREPELLLLDEPTNHLDIEALEWLEDYLVEYPGAVLVVSHDRYFLDRVVSRIFLLQEGKLQAYPGNYSEFELQYALQEKTRSREEEKMSRKIAALEEYVRKYGAGIKAKQARGRESQLKKLRAAAAPAAVPGVKAADKNTMNLSLRVSQRAGDRVLDVEGVSIQYGPKIIFENASLNLRRGDRVALLGKNGIGKTSLLKAIMGRVPYQGKIKLGASVRIGYYSQEHEDFLLGSDTAGSAGDIMEEMRLSSRLDDPQIRSVLARFGFRGEEVFKPLKGLSGGEKSRLALCKLFLCQGNLLLLDEPTNHLDANTREALEEALLNYDGTLIAVSHDRYFLNRMVNKIAVLSGAGIHIIEGDYTTYRENLDREKLREKEEKNLRPEEAIKASQMHRLEAKNNRRREKKLKQLEDSINQIEGLLQELERKMEALTDDYEEILRLHRQHEVLRNNHSELMEAWLELSE